MDDSATDGVTGTYVLEEDVIDELENVELSNLADSYQDTDGDAGDQLLDIESWLDQSDLG
jgi:hypothetical protein